MKRKPGARRPKLVPRAAPKQPQSPARPTSLSQHRQQQASQQTRRAADAAVAEGVPLHQAGQFAAAETCYRRALDLDAMHPEALHLSGLVAHQLGRPDVALPLIEQSISAAADRPSYHLNHGAVLRALGQHDAAIAAWRQALALHPAYPEAWNNLGVALQDQGQLAEATPCFERAVSLAPAYAEAHFNLGVAQQAARLPERAVASYRAALAIQPGHSAARYNLGNALRETDQFAEAVAAYRAVLANHPDHADTHNNLGVALQALGDRDAAIACFEQTILLQPAYPQAHTNLGHLLRDRGRFDEAMQAYRRALALQPGDMVAHSGLIFVLDHHEGATPADRLAERRAWDAQHARALTSAARPHQNQPDPARRLRVGYVSGDFFYHSAAAGFVPVLLGHDLQQIDVVCYATLTRTDAQTARIKAGVATWRDVTALSDAAVADLVRADGIDILVDLGGHSSSGRLGIFARKPAPIQVTAWGYITGTGLDAMDYLMADPVTVPPEAEHWYSERVVHLPSIVCYEPPTQVPEVVPPPLLSRGYVTFGSFNRATKLSDEALDLWARVVAAVPDARMLLKSPGLDDAENRTRILSAFAARGVTADRIDIMGQTNRFDHLAAYGEIDIQLDPFPHVGGATTFDGLLQGVPCVTLLGELIQGRLSASFLSMLGLDDLIAQTPDAYLTVATRLAQDVDRLTRERATLRQRLLASPLADTEAYTQAVEAQYRHLWHQWCARSAPPHPTIGPLDPHIPPTPSPASGRGRADQGEG
jgi:protein O-GlcNAc transferase